MQQDRPPYLIGKHFLGGVQWVCLWTFDEFDAEWKVTKKSAIGYERQGVIYVEIGRRLNSFVDVTALINNSMKRGEYKRYVVGDQNYIKWLENRAIIGYIISAIHLSDGDQDRATRAASSATGATIKTTSRIAGATIGAAYFSITGGIIGAFIGGTIGAVGGLIMEKKLNETIQNREVRERAGTLDLMVG